MQYRLSVDTGGTFTDVALMDEATGKVTVTKVPSTPENPAEAVLNGVQEMMAGGVTPEEITFFLHGTTVATNALLERKGAKTALITTEGFRDVLEIGRQTRPKLYDLYIEKQKVIIPRRFRYEVEERVDYTGKVLIELNEAQVYEIGKKIEAEGIEAVAICFLHSYKNPTHEQRVKELLEKVCPQIFVTISAEVLPEYREYERTSTVSINAYVMPKVSGYVGYLADKLKEKGIKSDLYIMQSNGGVITSEMAMHTSARTVLSGPAGGALAGAYIAEQTGIKNLITADMGGTSLDIALLKNGQPGLTVESSLGGYPLKLPMIDIHTIGSGGGSIAWIDEGGALKVGPESAGAVPGPVCYGRGGNLPTVTDANVVLGRLNPLDILGGRMKMDLAGAKNAIEEKIAKPLGITLEEASKGILKVVNANMARGIRVVSVERGYDPREFALTTFGGAGPLHAVDLAREIGAEKVIIPPHPGITSAIGMLIADVKHDYVQTLVIESEKADFKEINSLYATLENKAMTQLRNEGFKKDRVFMMYHLDLRYKGQSYELSVPVQRNSLTEQDMKKVIDKFHSLHKQVYGYNRMGQSVEIVNLRLVALGKLPEFKISSSTKKNNLQLKPLGTRLVFWDEEVLETPYYNREELGSGVVIMGPAVIEQLDSTTVVYPGQKAEIDDFGNIIINIGGQAL